MDQKENIKGLKYVEQNYQEKTWPSLPKTGQKLAQKINLKPILIANKRGQLWGTKKSIKRKTI